MNAKTKKTANADESMTTKVSEGARELVKRTTETAKERTDGLYETTKKYNADLESLLVRAAKGYVDILGNMADVTYKNVNRGIMTAEKLAEAKSLSEAQQIQMDYVRAQHDANMENARSAFDYVRETVTENTESLRDTASKVWSGDKNEKKAA